jgi:hypothetical protein
LPYWWDNFGAENHIGLEVAWMLVDHTMLDELQGMAWDGRMKQPLLVQLELRVAQELVVGRIAVELVLETVDHWHTN